MVKKSNILFTDHEECHGETGIERDLTWFCGESWKEVRIEIELELESVNLFDTINNFWSWLFYRFISGFIPGLELWIPFPMVSRGPFWNAYMATKRFIPDWLLWKLNASWNWQMHLQLWRSVFFPWWIQEQTLIWSHMFYTIGGEHYYHFMIFFH